MKHGTDLLWQVEFQSAVVLGAIGLALVRGVLAKSDPLRSGLSVEDAVEPPGRARPITQLTAARSTNLECPPQLEGLHILVDDEEGARDLLAALLDRFTIRVARALQFGLRANLIEL
jgi:hypothetical protein